MNQTLIGILTAALWLTAAPLPAQTVRLNEGIPILQDEPRETAAKPSRETMQEHIAVFRVLLNRGLEKTYGFPIQVPSPHHGFGGGGGFGGMMGGGGLAGMGGGGGLAGGGGGGRGLGDGFHQ